MVYTRLIAAVSNKCMIISIKKLVDSDQKYTLYIHIRFNMYIMRERERKMFIHNRMVGWLLY